MKTLQPQLPQIDKFDDLINLFANPARIAQHFADLKKWYADLSRILALVGTADEIEGLRAQATAALDEAKAVKAKAVTDSAQMIQDAQTERERLLAEGRAVGEQAGRDKAEAEQIKRDGQALADQGRLALESAGLNDGLAHTALARAQEREAEAATLKQEYEGKLAAIADVVRR